jgi:hypothetical protein
MNYPIPPNNVSESIGLRRSVDENALIDALRVVVLAARANGQTLQDVMDEVLAEDNLISANQRQLLSEVVSTAWEQIPVAKQELATVTSIVAEARCATSLLAG